jgi:hypothetical protein
MPSVDFVSGVSRLSNKLGSFWYSRFDAVLDVNTVSSSSPGAAFVAVGATPVLVDELDPQFVIS